MAWVIPRLVRLENVIRPRYWPFWRHHGDHVIGLVSLVMSIVATLPIPLGNWLPAFATALLGMSLVKRDGILLAAGGVLCMAALAVGIFMVGAAGAATQAALG